MKKNRVLTFAPSKKSAFCMATPAMICLFSSRNYRCRMKNERGLWSFMGIEVMVVI